MSAFSLPIPPVHLTMPPSQAYGTLRYRLGMYLSYPKPVASVCSFSPVTFSAQEDLNLDQ